MEAPKGFVRKQKTLDLTNSGLGFSLQGGIGSPAADGDEAVRVSDVQPRGAAYSAGVMVGDRIVAVGGVPFDHVTHEEVVNAIKAAIPDRVVRLIVERKADMDEVVDEDGKDSKDVAVTSSRDEVAHKAFKERNTELSRVAHELASAEESHKTESGQYIKAAVFGGLDGIITTFAVVASVTGANLPTGVVIVMGFANLLADGLSMGMGEYLSAKSEADFIAAERDREEWEFDNYPEGEVKEMIDLYKEQGFSEEDASQVMAIMKGNRKFFIDHMMVQELGLMPAGEDDSPLKQGAVMFCAFFLFGLVPLLSYIALSAAKDESDFLFGIACGLTAIALFALGAIKSRFSTQKWYTSGFWVLLNGGLAAVAAYLVGFLLDKFIDTENCA